MPHNDITQDYLDAQKYTGLTPRPSSMRERILQKFKPEYMARAREAHPVLANVERLSIWDFGIASMAFAVTLGLAVGGAVAVGPGLLAAIGAGVVVGRIGAAVAATCAIEFGTSEMKQFEQDLGSDADIASGKSKLAQRYEFEVVQAEQKELRDRRIAEIREVRGPLQNQRALPGATFGNAAERRGYHKGAIVTTGPVGTVPFAQAK